MDLKVLNLDVCRQNFFIYRGANRSGERLVDPSGFSTDLLVRAKTSAGSSVHQSRRSVIMMVYNLQRFTTADSETTSIAVTIYCNNRLKEYLFKINIAGKLILASRPKFWKIYLKIWPR